MLLQPLEPRVLLALSVSLDKGVLMVNGTDAADVIGVDVSGKMLSVTIGSAGFTLPASEVKRVMIQAGAGDDRVTFGPAVSLKTTLLGGPGNDYLSGATRANQINGEAGHDTLAGGASRDALTGGGGVDTVDYSSRVVALVITLDGKSNDGLPGNAKTGERDNVADDIENVRGGSANDRITGSAGRNTLQGGPGDDTLDGGGGDDLLVGGEGSDVLLGGAGDDVLLVIDASSADSLDGGDGFDSAALDSISGLKDALLSIENEASVLAV